jgi:hypothetical protein
MKNIEEIEDYNNYYKGVVERVNHHASEVDEVIKTLKMIVISKSDNIKVYEYLGEVKNTIWFSISDKKYVLTYSHKRKCILLLNMNLRGYIIARFSNNISSESVLEIFSKL